MMGKELIADKIYDAMRAECDANGELPIVRAEAVGAHVTNMTIGLVRHWLTVLERLGWVYRDGVKIRLVKDFGYIGEGPRIEEEIIGDQKISRGKAKKTKKARLTGEERKIVETMR